MATKKPDPKKPELKVEDVLPKKRASRMPIALVAVSILAFILLVVALHVTGVFKGPEEKIYNRVSGNEFLAVVFKGFHHPDYKSKLTTEEAINVLELQKNITITANNLDTVAKSADSQIRDKDKKIADLQGRIVSLETRLKPIEENAQAAGTVPATPPATTAAAAPAAAGPQAAALPLPAAITGPQAQAFKTAVLGKDYRKASKIIDAMATDQAVDVLNNIADMTDMVEILVLLKEKRAGEIIAALEPKKGGEVMRMILDRKGGV